MKRRRLCSSDLQKLVRLSTHLCGRQLRSNHWELLLSPRRSSATSDETGKASQHWAEGP
jgi:hypothetical protein